MAARAFIVGVSGPVLTPEEGVFLRSSRPWGLILFKRNVESPERLRALIADLRDALGWQAPVLVDQEGGRVQRLGPPHWPLYPPGGAYGRLYDLDRELGCAAACLGARLIAADLAAVGIDVDCVPLADVPVTAADPVIGDRAYGDTPAKVASIAAAVAEGLLAGGVLPVLKHLPGHGRARVDSHAELPVVTADRAILERTDFAAFRPLARLPLGMTAHVVFTAFDPVRPATHSAIMIADVIRGLIGFSGALMSDDIGMGALSGTPAERAHAALAGGCDLVLHCNGNLQQMREVADAAPELTGRAAERAEAALALRRRATDFDVEAGRARFSTIMSGAPARG